MGGVSLSHWASKFYLDLPPNLLVIQFANFQKEFHEPLPDNHLLSVRRLRGLLQRLKHDLEILKEYDHMIQEQLAKGVLEPVSPMKRPPIKCTISLITAWSAVTRQPPSCVWSMTRLQPRRHLACHCAYTKDPNFTGLFLISFDSDPTKSPSLPMWRRHSSWLQSMRRTVMFSDSFRWTMWLKKSLSYVCTGSLEWCLVCYLAPLYSVRLWSTTNEATVKCLLRSTYVDDIISSANSDEEAFELYTQAKEIFHQGGLTSGSFCPTANPYRPRLMQKGWQTQI